MIIVWQICGNCFPIILFSLISLLLSNHNVPDASELIHILNPYVFSIYLFQCYTRPNKFLPYKVVIIINNSFLILKLATVIWSMLEYLTQCQALSPLLGGLGSGLRKDCVSITEENLKLTHAKLRFCGCHVFLCEYRTGLQQERAERMVATFDVTHEPGFRFINPQSYSYSWL